MRVALVALLLLTHHLSAQHPAFWQLSDEQGLPSVTVFDLYQDTKGYIWLATESGLYSYDGSSFKLYKPITSKSSAVSNIQEDSKGKLWLMNFSGQLFYIQQDSVYEYHLPKELGGVTGYFIDSKDQLYTYHGNKSWYKNLAPDKVEFLFLAGDHIEELEGGKLFAFNFNYQCLLVDEKQRIQRNIPTEFIYPETHSYRHQKIGKHHILLERNTDKAYLLELNQEKIMKIAPFEFQKNNIGGKKSVELNAVRTDQDENIWILTYTGLYAYDKNLRPLYQEKNGKDKALFAGKPISDIIQDKEGNYWVSTLSDGIFVMPYKDLLVFQENLEGLEDKHIYKITKDDNNNLLLGTYNGKVKVFNPTTQTIENEYITDSRKEVEAIFFDKIHQKVFVGCSRSYFFHKNQSKFYRISAESAPKSFAMYDDILLAAGAEGISFTPITSPNNFIERYEKKSLLNYNGTHYYPIKEKVRARVVFVEPQARKIWLGYSDGLFAWEEGVITEAKWQDSISIFAKSIVQDPQGNIWVGSLTQGVFLIKNGKIVRKIDTQAGLPSNLCFDLFAEKNTLWIGTDEGVAKLNTENFGVEIYNRQDGLPSEQINGLVGFEENMWLATPKGLVKLPKSMPSRNTVAPMIYVEKVFVWERPLPFSASYQLNYEENNLRINFLGVTYRGRGLFRYKYRMIGLDSSWIYTSSSNSFARYPSLPAGKYEFQVKAVNEDNIESEGTAILQIEIKSPLWQKGWFWLLILVLLALAIFLVVRWRFHLLQKRNKVERNLRESQLAALKVQMNPHFIFNALNSIQEFILLNEKKLANQYLGKFADLMRMTLDMSNEEAVSLQEEIKMLDVYLQLEALRFENLQYQLSVDENLHAGNILLPPMLIQPYIENALKHGLLHKKGHQKLNISFQKKDKYLECIVEDNGIGRKKSAEINHQNRRKHKSFAIGATQKRLDLLNYGNKKAIQSETIDLYDEQNQAIGTKVIIRIPMV